MIEWMVRQDRSEREIVAAVKRETGGSTEPHEPARLMEHLGNLARRILGAPRH
jgi:hypothetical protein